VCHAGVQARELLASRNSRLVASIALKHLGRGLALEVPTHVMSSSSRSSMHQLRTWRLPQGERVCGRRCVQQASGLGRGDCSVLMAGICLPAGQGNAYAVRTRHPSSSAGREWMNR
jgi:hypothetical protein